MLYPHFQLKKNSTKQINFNRKFQNKNANKIPIETRTLYNSTNFTVLMMTLVPGVKHLPDTLDSLHVSLARFKRQRHDLRAYPNPIIILTYQLK